MTKEERKKYFLLMRAQQLRTIKKEGVVYTPEPWDIERFKKEIFISLKNRLNKDNFPKMERACCKYVMERDKITLFEAHRRTIGGYMICFNGDTKEVIEKWKRKAKRKKTCIF